MIKIYLDWNVVSNMLEAAKLPTDMELTETQANHLLLHQIFVLQRNENLVIPYSNAHLQDIKGAKNIEEKLEYLGFLSNDICIGQYWDHDQIIWHQISTEENYNTETEEDFTLEKLTEDLEDSGLSNIFDMYKILPHGVDFTTFDNSFPRAQEIFKRSKNENSMYAMMQDVFDLYKAMKTDFTLYRELRNITRSHINVDTNLSNMDNAIETLNSFLPKTIIGKSFDELLPKYDGKTAKNKDYTDIINLYMQLDYFGFNPDKLSEKNQWDNLFRDSLHCFYGAHCDYYITNETKAIKKSLTVYKKLNITTQVLTPNDFIKIILKNDEDH